MIVLLRLIFNGNKTVKHGKKIQEEEEEEEGFINKVINSDEIEKKGTVSAPKYCKKKQ